jgi:hypothetical protein
VNRDEARQLASRYAMGSLTESERQLLFEAALEDQDLFDELAHEDELKQLLDEPGARDRLIAAVTPPVVERPTWRMPLVWGGVAIAAAIVAVVGWVAFRPAKPVEVARVAVDAVTPAPPVADRSQPSPPVASTAPADQPVPVKNVAPPPAAAPASEPKQAERDGSRDAQPAGAVGGSRGGGGGGGAPQPRAGLQQSPSQQAPSQSSSQQTVQVQAQNGFLPSAPIAPRAAAPAARSVTVAAAAAAKLVRFGFDYTVEPEFLTLKFATDGWLSLHFSPGDDTISLAHVTAGQIRREAIPNNATEADIVFAVEAQTDPTLGVNLTRSDKSGTVEDPSGRRIEFLLKFY